jgi:hypothetical protein
MMPNKKIAKRLLLVFLLLCTATAVAACIPEKIAKKDAFPGVYNERPLTILVLPPVNQSTAAEAKEYYLTTVAEPLAYAGYYVLPIEVTNEIMKSIGLYDAEVIDDSQLPKFKQFFGADAALFVKIIKWDTSYAVLAGNVTVHVDCVLKSTTTHEKLWQYEGKIVIDTSGGSSGSSGLAGLLVKAVVTAITTATTDYVPIARRVNYMVISTMPYGKYHPAHGTDQQMEILKKGSAK